MHCLLKTNVSKAGGLYLTHCIDGKLDSLSQLIIKYSQTMIHLSHLYITLNTSQLWQGNSVTNRAAITDYLIGQLTKYLSTQWTRGYFWVSTGYCQGNLLASTQQLAGIIMTKCQNTVGAKVHFSSCKPTIIHQSMKFGTIEQPQ